MGVQPLAEGGERGGRDVGVPGCGEVADAGLVGKIVVERAVAGLGGDEVLQAVGDAGLPGRIGEAGLADEDAGVGRVLPAAGLGGVEQPGDGLAGRIAVVGRVEIGGDVLQEPGEAGGDVGGEFGRVDLAAGGAQLGAGEAELLEAFELGGRAFLPHDELIRVERRREGGPGPQQQKCGEEVAHQRPSSGVT